MCSHDIFRETPFGNTINQGEWKCKYCGKQMSDNINGYCLDCWYSGKRKDWRDELVKKLQEMEF